MFLGLNSEVLAIKDIINDVDLNPSYGGFANVEKHDVSLEDLGTPVQKEKSVSDEIDDLLKENGPLDHGHAPVSSSVNKTDYVETDEVQKIVAIRFIGNKYTSDGEIEKLIVSKSGNYFRRELVVADLTNLYKTGYFIKSSIEAQPILVDDGVELNYYLKENPVVKDVLVFGNQTSNKVNAYDYLTDLIGKPQSIPATSATLRKLEEAYSAQGMVLARVRDIKWDENNATFRVYIAEGILSQIVFEGNQKTKDIYLKNVIGHTKEGETYNEKVFLKDFKRLRKTGYFKDVKRELVADEDGETYQLKIILQEDRNTKLGLGGGANVGTGLFGNASVRVGNIRGEGHNFDLNGVFGTGVGANAGIADDQSFFREAAQTRINASYSIPYFRNSRNTVRLFTNFITGNNFQVDFSEQTAIGGGVGLSRVLGELDNQVFQSNLAFNYLDLEGAEDNNYIRDITDNIMALEGFNPDRIRRQARDSDGDGNPDSPSSRAVLRSARQRARDIREEQLVTGPFVNLKTTYTFKDLDSNDRPRKGGISTFTLDPVLGFDEIDSHTKVSASISRYFALPKESSILFNVRAGQEILGDVPRFNQFRLGGNGGVRGYRALSQLGFGNSLAIGTAEIRTPVYNFVPAFKRMKLLKSVDFAVFSDFGLVGGETYFNEITDRLSRAWSVGFGVRVALPFVGRIRVDLGFPLVEALLDDQFFRLNFGPADRF